MRYIIKNWCSECEDFVKTETIEVADAKGFKCVNCAFYTNYFKLPKHKIMTRNNGKSHLILEQDLRNYGKN